MRGHPAARREVAADPEAHTVTHPNLADASDAESWAEIEIGRRALEDVLGGPSLAFCYLGGSSGRGSTSTSVHPASATRSPLSPGPTPRR